MSYKEKIKSAYAALMKYYPLTIEDLPDEEWLLVPDYDAYQVSTFGRIKSFYNDDVRILKPWVSAFGYLQVDLFKNSKPKHFPVHRLVAKLFIPNPEDKLEVNHRDGCKLNNFVGNLEWVTREQNIQHSFNIGIAPQGQDRPEAKLTNEQVLYVRNNPQHLNTMELAKMFGVDNITISRIQRGKTYKTAGGPVRQGKAQKYTPRIPDDLRAQIRAEYVYGSRGFGTEALAKKYGYTSKTIWNIVNERRNKDE